MDINRLIKNINNLNDYIATTQDASEKCKSSKIQLNISTVLALKQIRSLEIEYFNKCEENGIACMIFERILSLPASKKWGVLGKELISLLQYWLDALRKHLVKHNLHWWTFMKLLLRFLQEVRTKDVSMPDTLVEHTAECLLDLATNDHPDANQRQQILHCLNVFCLESSRELRFALRKGFGGYFVKLSAIMATCGYLPCQYSILETLLRWLLPRKDHALRLVSASSWFPPTLYSRKVADIFLERSWLGFFQDARDLLNTHNSAGELITSVVCKRLAVGNVVIITGTERPDVWLDINSPSRCISILLDPRVLEAFGSSNHKTFDTLIITNDITQCAKLYRQDKRLIISVTTLRPPQTLTSTIAVNDSRDVTIMVTTHDVKRLDAALRCIFGDKYQILLDLEKETALSPSTEEEIIDRSQECQENQRFSHPVAPKHRIRSGYVVRQLRPANWKSPSSVSTTSLALLHEKLAALPHYRYDKKPMSVCAFPDLSVVSEHSETDRLSCYKPYSLYRRRRVTPSKSPIRKSQSDGDNTLVKQNKLISPVVSENNEISCLLAVTVGSIDDSAINDTIQRMANHKDYNGDNTVDLLMQEAIEAGINKYENNDSGINTGRKTQNFSGNPDFVENTPNLERNKILEDVTAQDNMNKNKPTKIVESTTTDESNTDYVNDTPIDFVNVRNRKKFRNKVDSTDKQSFDVRTVEEFFSQHLSENPAGEVIISPKLARKLNETSSETSDFDDNCVLTKDVIIDNCNFNQLDVIKCLNSMVDKVCDEFDKCTEYLNQDDEITAIVNPTETGRDSLPLRNIINTVPDMESKKKTPKKVEPKSKRVKLKLKIKPRKNADNKKTRGRPRKDKHLLESTSKISTIIEDNTLEDTTNEINNEVTQTGEVITKNNDEIVQIINEENDVNEIVDVVSKNNDDSIDVTHIDKEKPSPDLNRNSTTPLLRRKRKLYSPKDDLTEKPIHISETEEDDIALSEFKLKSTPKTKATFYKDIERDRKKHIRIPRNKKCKVSVDIPSPRTKKRNDIFDKLKETSEGEQVTLANKTSDMDVYNFSSDSEDDDFKKINLRKRNSTTTVGSIESARPKKRRVNRAENKLENKTKRKATRGKKTKTKIVEPVNDIEDERMREANDVLNTSIVVDLSAKKNNKIDEPELVLKEPPIMEFIEDEAIEKPKNKTQKKKNRVEPPLAEMIEDRAIEKPNNVTQKKKNKIEHTKSLKLNKKRNNKSMLQDDRTESPLPGLVVEPILDTNKDVDLSANMVDKFKKIYRAGPESYANDTNTTQNLLSDVEKVNFRTSNINITEEIYQIEDPNEYNEITNNTIFTRSKSRSNNPKNYADTDTNRKSKTIKRSRSSIEVIELCENKSDRSFATQGITGHGDFDEMPPKSLEENIQHRDIEELDQSFQNYFNELNKYIVCPSNRNDNLNEYMAESPVVSVKILSPKEMKGGNNKKNSDDYSALSPVVSVGRLSRKVTKDYTKNTFQSETSASPVVSMKRLSPEDISRWLPSRRNSDTNSSKTIVTSNKRVIEKITTDDSDDSRRRKSSRIINKINTTFEKRVSEESAKNKSANRSLDEKRMITRITRSSVAKVSMISPVKYFEDFISNRNNESVDKCLSHDEEYMAEIINTMSKSDFKSSRNDNVKRDTRSKSDFKSSRNDNEKRDTRSKSDFKSSRNDNERRDTKSKSDFKSLRNGNERRDTMSKRDFKSSLNDNERRDTKSKRDFKSLRNDNEGRDTMSKSDFKSSRKDNERRHTMSKNVFNSARKVLSFRKEIQESSSGSSSISNISTSTKKPDTLKRLSTVERVAKKKSIDMEEVVDLSSSEAISSVHDWFRRNVPSSNREEIGEISVKDTLDNILEKLDTTLAEIQQNTSKKFAHLFVNAHRHLSELKQARCDMHKEYSSAIVKQVLQLLDKKFTELDERSQEMDDDFMKQLKEQASEFIREDCNSKQTMVRLIREDIQTMSHNMRTRTGSRLAYRY